MEADLQRFYKIDYRDRWRGDLTLRRLMVLVRHLPADSACVLASNDGREPLDRTDALLADIWQAASRSKHRHPVLSDALSRQRKTIDPARRRVIAAARQRARRRRAAIERGDIT